MRTLSASSSLFASLATLVSLRSLSSFQSLSDLFHWFVAKSQTDPLVPAGAQSLSDAECGRSDDAESGFVCAQCGWRIQKSHNVYCMLDRQFCSQRCRVAAFQLYES